MKHIFLIHSHTLLLTSLGVINREKLAEEDVIFIYSRNYRSCIPVNFQCFDFSKESIDKNIGRLTNQLWKLIPMRENNENW